MCRTHYAEVTINRVELSENQKLIIFTDSVNPRGVTNGVTFQEVDPGVFGLVLYNAPHSLILLNAG